MYNDTSYFPPANCECNANEYCDMKSVLVRNGAALEDDSDPNRPHAGAKGADSRMWCHTKRTDRCPVDWTFCEKRLVHQIDAGVDNESVEKRARKAEKKAEVKEKQQERGHKAAVKAAMEAAEEAKRKKAQKADLDYVQLNDPPTMVSVRVSNDTTWHPPEECQCSEQAFSDMKSILERNGLEADTTSKHPHGANLPHAGSKGTKARMWC